MLREHLLTVALLATISVCCLGFIPDRTVNIPATWNIAPSLEVDPKVRTDRNPNTKTDSIGEQKDLQATSTASDSKETTKNTMEQTGSTTDDASREKRFDYTVQGTDARPTKLLELKSLIENVESTENVDTTPRNVVMIIAEPGRDQKDFWKNFTASHPFPVQATLQSCNNEAATRTRFSLDDAFIPGNRDKSRDCEHQLRSSIVSLLFWTRDVKGMTTGTLSNSTFGIPSLFGYEESVGFSRELDDIDENNMKPENRKLRPEIRGDWHLIDLGKPANRASSPLMPVQSTREDGEAAWNVFDVFSKIRLVLFRSLLESLGGNAASEDSVLPRRSHGPLRSSLVDMVEELKSIENEKGFIFVSSVSGNELESALDPLQRQVSQDTLVVVMGVCSHDASPVPLFAQGPSARTLLREASAVWDVPSVIRSLMSDGCQDKSNCKSRRHDDVSPPAIGPLKIVPRNAPVFRRSSRETASKLDDGKKATIKDEVKKVADLDTKEDAKSVDELNSKKEEGVKNGLSPKVENRNSAKCLEAERFTMLVGTFVSVVAAFVLTS